MTPFNSCSLTRLAGTLAVVVLGCAPVLTSAFDQAPATGAASGATAQAGGSARDWIQLFNGRDLADWTIKFAKHDLGENFANTFRVEDGLLKVRYDQWPAFDGEFGHIFYKDPFSYYLIAAEYRFVGEQVEISITSWGGPHLLQGSVLVLLARRRVSLRR